MVLGRCEFTQSAVRGGVPCNRAGRCAQIGTLIIATSGIQLANGFLGTSISLPVILHNFEAATAGLVLGSVQLVGKIGVAFAQLEWVVFVVAKRTDGTIKMAESHERIAKAPSTTGANS
jgi:hypothetical protein